MSRLRADISSDPSRYASWRVERAALQTIVAVACLVPLLAGGTGMVRGLSGESGTVTAIALDSHVRYLSGLLFAIGVAFAVSIPRIERHGRRVRLLTGLVVVGGAGRLIGLLTVGLPSRPMLFALAMELLVAPLLALWQTRVARGPTSSGTPAATAR